MLDRESKREKILEGKLREIKIKLKKQQEQQEARAKDLLARQAEKAIEEVKAQEEVPLVKPSLSQSKENCQPAGVNYLNIHYLSPALIETAVIEFNQMIEEELQRRIAEQETQEQNENYKKSPKIEKKKENGLSGPVESDNEEQKHDLHAENGTQNGHQSNGTSNGHHDENGNGAEDESSVTSTI